MTSNAFPRVLLLGNGLLRLGGGRGWKDLLNDITTNHIKDTDLKGIPYAMQPEVACGTNVEDVQRRIAQKIQDSPLHDLLKELLNLNFDAILTTNYTYEIERILCADNWSSSQRKKAFFAMDGKSHAHLNTCICNLIRCKNEKTIPVFHVHGEKERKPSLILSYYSYANSVSKLVEYNRSRANQYQEYQQESPTMEVYSWLDFFLMGEVYAVGFGFDPSEFDIWWAVERKSREKAIHGKLQVFLITTEKDTLPQEALLKAMDAEYTRINVEPSTYEDGYRKAITQIKKLMTDS